VKNQYKSIRKTHITADNKQALSELRTVEINSIRIALLNKASKSMNAQSKYAFFF